MARACAEFRHVLGDKRKAKMRARMQEPSLFDVVALLTDLPAKQLARGQVGTILEQIDDKTLLVEFSDDRGQAYAVARCLRRELLVLRYAPQAA